MAEPFLVLRGISKRFGRKEALHSVHLEVSRDELVVVLGPTGAGKTTLLRTIVGLETPEAGKVIMESRDITHLTPPARDMALVFQDFLLYPTWTVRENLAFPLKAPGRNLSSAEVEQQVKSAASLLKIRHLLARRAVTLSGGEMQRVAIGRAIVRHPRMFLMDEPLSNLDAKLREELRVELVALRRKLETPMLFVTHDQVEALSMGDRIVVLSEGHILQSGTPEEIYRRPTSPAVARQLGQPAINILNVTMSGGNWVTESGVPLMPADGGPEREMVLGVRPEDIEPAGGTHAGVLRVVENMGAVKLLLVDWVGTQVHIIAPRDLSVRPGDEIFPRLNPGRVLLWSPEGQPQMAD